MDYKYNCVKNQVKRKSKRQEKRERKAELKAKPKLAQMTREQRLSKKAAKLKPSWYDVLSGIRVTRQHRTIKEQRELNRYKQVLNEWHKAYKLRKETND